MTQPFTDATHALVFESPDIEILVLIDVDRIATVIGNLLTNAIKYSPAGGPVTLDVSLDASLADEGSYTVTTHYAFTAPAAWRLSRTISTNARRAAVYDRHPSPMTLPFAAAVMIELRWVSSL